VADFNSIYIKQWYSHAEARTHIKAQHKGTRGQAKATM